MKCATRDLRNKTVFYPLPLLFRSSSAFIILSRNHAFITKACAMNNKSRIKSFCGFAQSNSHFGTPREGAFLVPSRSPETSPALPPASSPPVPPTSLPTEHSRVSCSSLIYSPSIDRSSLPDSRLLSRTRAHARTYARIRAHERMLSGDSRRESVVVHWHCSQSSRNVPTERGRERERM